MTRNKFSNINANIFNVKPCVRDFLQRYHRYDRSWVSVRNVGRCMFFNLCICLCFCVVHMSTIVPHSLEVAAEMKENNKGM